MLYIPVADAGVHPVCGCDGAHASPQTTSQTKQAVLCERAAPKHIGYIQTSKTHYRLSHMFEIDTYLTLQVSRLLAIEMHKARACKS